MDHVPAYDYTDTTPDHMKTRIHTSEFVIGNVNINEDIKTGVGLNQNKKKSSSSSTSNNNNYYEFIIHKIIQYDVRKFPDEIVAKNVVIQGNRK